eukprot:TRINITY_DN911_c0_g4_i1.p1 TRINITY_DN911_c0_g4~~TRINITY_DN911_c0_g4_i1.p1  ORF type:complete len:469 (-),score=149.83 TRINITY_DN911_c0_g4_i1:67-1473(-)
MLDQQVVKNLFSLSADETIFDDFACTYETKPGKLYVMENNLCFHSDFLSTTKLVLRLADVQGVERLPAGIRVDAGQKHEFTKFEDVDAAYRCVQTSWAACKPEAAEKAGAEAEVKSPKENPKEDVKEERKSIREEKKASDDEIKVNNLQPNAKIVEEVKEKSSSVQNTRYIEMEDPQVLKDSFDKYQKRDNEYLRAVFGFTVEEYYKRFAEEGCPYSDMKNLEVMGSTEFSTEGWKDSLENPGHKVRTLTLQYKLAKSVLVSTAYTIKESDVEYDGDKFVLKTKTSTPKVPFGTSFDVHERIEVLPLEEIGGSVLIVTMEIIFTKSIFLKGTVVGANTAEYKRYWDTWTREVKSRHLDYPPGYTPQEEVKRQDVRRTELQHKIEKAGDVSSGAEEGRYERMGKEAMKWSKSYWYLIVIGIMMFFMWYYMNYITGLHARVDKLGKSIEDLVEAYAQRVNSTVQGTNSAY